MTETDFQRMAKARRDAVSLNASLRMRGLPTVAVPPAPVKPQVRVAYETDGTYAGVLAAGEECPVGCVVKLETAK